MAEVEYIGDHADQVPTKLRSVFRNKPRLGALAKALGTAVQVFEDAFASVGSDTALDGATGVVLDLWGRLVGEERSGLTDAEYRRVIAARTLANRSKGIEDDIYNVLVTLVPVDQAEEVSLTARYPASIYVRVRTSWRPRVQYVRRASTILRLAKAGGVSLSGSWAVDVAYGFSGNPAIAGLDAGKLAYSL